MQKATLQQRESFITADGSTIRELAHPAWTAAENQSLAEASVQPGAETAEHYHPRSEELYYFVAGEGRMRLDEDEAPVGGGRLRRHPAGYAPQAVEHRDHHARAAVLLCARIFR